jgi:hypothetical protein
VTFVAGNTGGTTMNRNKPVIVYAASGYTGRLTCESLTALRIPFVAAGRSQTRLDEVVTEMRARGAECEAQVAEHTPLGLRKLFAGARVVVNISGPFSLLGHAVVDAALVEGCHYVDSTGEQDFMLDLRNDYGPTFEHARLALAPSSSFLWALGTTAAEVCLETPGIDSLDVVYAPPSLQTVSSLQSMIRSARRPGYSIADGKLALLPIADIQKKELPGLKPRKALRTGAGEAAFFLDNPRVKNCDTWFANDTLARIAPYFGLWSRLSNVISGQTLDQWSDALTLKFKKDPPQEDPSSSRFIVAATGTGGGKRVRVVADGVSCYDLTGFTAAISAQYLLDGKAQRFGYGSMAQLFGARTVLTRLEERGTKTTVEIDGRHERAAASRASADQFVGA